MLTLIAAWFAFLAGFVAHALLWPRPDCEECARLVRIIRRIR